MKVEILIYAYLAICASMILFNIACIFVFRHKDKKLEIRHDAFTKKVSAQIQNGQVDEEHCAYLSKKLRRIDHLMAFDKTLEELCAAQPEKTAAYMESLSRTFISLTMEYSRKNALQAAYFPYIIQKYQFFKGKNVPDVAYTLLKLVESPSLYCRENALKALYAIGDISDVALALHILDKGGYYHNPKLITNGLLTFTGDAAGLDDLLWEQLPDFSENMQIAVLDYFRFHTGRHCERMLQFMRSHTEEKELEYRCIRYFGKYHYDPAYPCLIDLAQSVDEANWEETAIAASALAIYPGDRTDEILKSLLGSRNWYVRYNASQSLLQLGKDYMDLIDVFEGDDRYAKEIMRYRLDQQKMKREEAAAK